MTNELFEIARRRRSCRKFTGEKIPDAIVDEILNVALLAPSSWGGHPIEFVVVRDKSMLQKIARCKRMGAQPLPQADVAIVVMANTTGLELWIEDAAVASTYILLAAEQFNVGACWIHIRNRAGQRTTADEEIRQLLNVPDNFSVLNVVALGVKGENKSARTTKDLQLKNIHREKF